MQARYLCSKSFFLFLSFCHKVVCFSKGFTYTLSFGGFSFQFLFHVHWCFVPYMYVYVRVSDPPEVEL